MALSQIQCLDDNNVNPRTHESKPDFLYSEDQRLAVEVLLQDGREAFFKYLEARSLRGFLSDLELDTLAGSVEPYDPGLEIFPEDAEEDEPPLSLHYWPELSDTSIPMMDLGWPDSSSYRGVTRTTVYSQPPLEGQVHIKEVIRKMIAQAQKVIAVVMDVFTDVDIFRDLLDAGFKRKVSVYILLERTTLPHFLSMCRRANMHPGHLKQLRVRCTEGVQFHTRSTTIVRGRMGHRFMFVDGDKAVSGSYSFTWMSSRLEKNLVTVVTGQAVDAFDKLFRVLYGTSSLVDLRQVPTDPEPEPEPLPQPTSVALPSAALARKLYSPKYALALGNPSSTSSDSHNSPINTQSQENSGNPEVPDAKKGRQRRASKEAREEAHPIHPGLVDLEKAYLIEYLPIWPEPDPSSDIIGFINVRDNSKPIPVHLQRSEMFETSRAIRFSSPVNMPKETLPEVAKPRKLSAKPEEMNKLKPAQDKTKAGEKSMGDGGHPTQLNAQPGDIKSKAEATQQNSPLSGAPESDTAKTLKSEDKLHSNTPTNKDAGHYTTPHLNAPPQSSNKASAPNTGRPSHNTQAVTTNNPTPESQPGSKAKKEAETTLNKQKVIVSMTYTLESNSTQTSHLSRLAASKTRQHSPTESVLPHADSHTQAIHKQPQKSSEMTPNLQTPTVNSNVSPSSSTPPVPKPRTIQLVIKDGITSNGQKLPELSVIRRPETSTGPLVVQNEPAVEHKTSPEKKRKTVPELQNNSGKKTGAQKVADNTGNIREDAQQKQSWTSRETKNEKAVGLQDDSAGMQLVSGANLEALSDVLITDAPKAESVNIQEIIPKDVEPKTLTSVGCKLTPQLVCVATGQAGTKAPETAQTGCEFSEVPNKNSKNVTQCKAYRASVHEPQIISYCEMSPQDIGVLDNVDSLKSPKYTPVAEKSLRLLLSDTNMPDMRLPTPERESRSHAALVRTPTPEGLLPRSPTPDSRTHTPDPHSYTPDFRTPTPDGYVSARADSALSTTSEEYYECSDSPSREPVFDRAAHRNHGTTEDHVSVTHTNTPNATTAATGATYVNDHTCAATLGPTDRNTSSSETQSLPGPASLSSSSSLLEKKGEMGKEQEETANEENGREVDEKGSKLSVAEMRTEGDSQGAQRTGSKEATTTADHFSQRKDLTETVEKSLEAQPQVLKRKKVSNQSTTGRSVDGRVTPGVSTNEGAEQKRWSTGDLKPKKIPSEGERPDKERAVDRGALGANGVEKRVRPQSAREADGQKILHTPPRPLRGQQQDRGASSPPQKSRSTLSLSAKQPSGSRPLGSRQLNQAESKALHSSLQVLDSTLSSRKPPARPAPPVAAGAVGSAAGRKQAEASHSQQSLLSQQPLSAQGRARAGQLPNQHLYQNPQASFLHTHSNTLSQPHPHSQNQTVSAQEAHGQEEGKSPFSVTFSRLYSLKGLKDRMSKKGSTSPPVQGRKSTS